MRQGILAIIIALFYSFSSSYAAEQTSDDNRLIDIGGGRKMYLECQGTGSPTVVFVSGRSDRSDIWKTVADTVKIGQAVYPSFLCGSVPLW